MFRCSFVTMLVLSVVTGLVTSCGPIDLRGDVTTGRNVKVQSDNLRAWPAPNEKGIIEFENRRYVEARKDETISDIARRIGEDPLVLSEINGIPPDRKLQSGKVLSIPVDRLSSSLTTEEVSAIASRAIENTGEVAPSFGVDEESAYETFGRHRVQKGETAYTIAQLYGISVRTIADWNDLGPDFAVQVGDVLIIPMPAEPDEGRSETTTPAPATAAAPLLDDIAVPEVPPSPDLDQSASAATASSTGDPEATVQRTFAQPMQGTLLSGYAEGTGGNEGIDIAAAPGTKIMAAAEGSVALVSRLTDDSVILLLRHADDMYSVYQNLSGVSLEKNDPVTKGQQIGELDGGAEYLHFEIRKGTRSVNPLDFLPLGSFETL